MTEQQADEAYRIRVSTRKSGRLRWLRASNGYVDTACRRYSIIPLPEPGGLRPIRRSRPSNRLYQLINNDEHVVVAQLETRIADCKRIAQKDFSARLNRCALGPVSPPQ